MFEEALKSEIAELRRRLEEAEETISAIREGAVDALVMDERGGTRIYSMESADRPYRILVEQMQQGAATLQGGGTILYANQQLADLLEVPLEKLFGAALRDFIASDDRAVFESLLQQGQTQSGHDEARLRRPNGTLVPVYLTFNVLPKESGAAIGVLVTDLTAQRHHERLTAAHTSLLKSEAALRDSEQRFRAMADNIAQLAWTCDWLGEVTWYNQRWFDYTGLTFDKMAGWGWKQVQHPDHVDRVVASVTQSRTTGEIWEDTFPLRGKDGIYRWFLSRAVPIRDDAGNVVRWFGTNTDITKEREAEERQRLLANEIEHRGKNLLAVVQALVHRSLSGERSLQEARDTLSERINALLRSQSLLLNGGFEGARLSDIVRLEFEGFSQHVSASGPDLVLNQRSTQAMALALHELATNATKHGALSRPEGKVMIDWSIAGVNAEARFSFQWRESGGPPVVPPTRKGFGRTLIEKALAQDFGAQPELEFAPEGLRYRIDAPLSTILGQPLAETHEPGLELN